MAHESDGPLSAADIMRAAPGDGLEITGPGPQEPSARPPHTVAAGHPSVVVEPEATAHASVPQHVPPSPPAGGNGSPPPYSGGWEEERPKRKWTTYASAPFRLMWRNHEFMVRVFFAAVTVWGLANQLHFSVAALTKWAWSETLFNTEPGFRRMWAQHPFDVGLPLVVDGVLIAAVMLLLVHCWHVWRRGWKAQRKLAEAMEDEKLARRKLIDHDARLFNTKMLVMSTVLSVMLSGYLLGLQRDNLPFAPADLAPWLWVAIALVGWGTAANVSIGTCWRALNKHGRIMAAVLLLAIFGLLLVKFDSIRSWDSIKLYWHLAAFTLLVLGLYMAQFGLTLTGARTVHTDSSDDNDTGLGHAGHGLRHPETATHGAVHPAAFGKGR